MISIMLATMLIFAPPADLKAPEVVVLSERLSVPPPQPMQISIGALYSFFGDCSGPYERLLHHIFPVRSHLMDMMRSTEHEHEKDDFDH